MKLRHATLSGYRSYGAEPVSVEFTDGLTAIVGPNGSGKSSILGAVMWALFGSTGGLTLPELVHAGERDATVQVQFEHHGRLYMAERRHRLTPQGEAGTSTLVFGRVDVPDNLSRETIALTQQAIVDLIGTPQLAAATWFCAQGQANAFLSAAPAERRDILGQMLGLTAEWDKLHEVSRAREAGSVTACSRLESAIETAREQARQAPELEQELESVRDRRAEAQQALQLAASDSADAAVAVRDAEAKAADYKRWLSQVSDTELQLMSAERALADSRQRLDELDRMFTPEYAEALRKRQEAAALRGMLEKAFVQASNTESALRRIGQQLDGARSRAAAVTDTCPTCGQKLDPDAYGRVNQAVERAKAEVKELEAEHGELTARLGRSSHDIQQEMAGFPEDRSLEQDVRAHASASDIQENRLQENDRLVASRDEIQSRLDDLRDAEPPKLSDEYIAHRRQMLALKEQRQASANAELQNVNVAYGRVEAQLEAARRAETQVVTLSKELGAAQARLELDQYRTAALAPAGARQLVLDTALPQIEGEANRILDVLRPGTIVQFLTQREGGKRELLDVRVVDESGYRRWETLSGGEGTRVMFAVRVAMSLAAANAHGLASLPAFVFDEAVGDQDSEGREAFITACSQLVGDVDQVIAVTHDSELVEKIDNVLRVEKVNGTSQIIGQ